MFGLSQRYVVSVVVSHDDGTHKNGGERFEIEWKEDFRLTLQHLGVK